MAMNIDKPIDWQAPLPTPEMKHAQRLRHEVITALQELADGTQPVSLLGMLTVSDMPLSIGQLSASAEVMPSEQREGLGSLVLAGLVYQDENRRFQIHPSLHI